jgi:amino acid adenylation domain-containing protein
VIDDDGVLRYRELAARAAAVADVVRRNGGSRPVGLLCRHGGPMIAAMLGVLFAGRAYVPLDPTFPARRLAYQLTDSGAELLLTDTVDHALAEDAPRVVDIDPVLADASTVDLTGLEPAEPDDLAYLLYTSGSTGTPKGVWQNHRNVVFAARNHIRNCAITPADRTSVLTSFGFDMAVTDTYSALLSGAAAAPIDLRGHGISRLADLLTERGVTLYHSTPTVYRYLVASLGARRLPGIRVVLLGGEAVTTRDLRLCRRHFDPECVFVNGYGATEVSFITQNHIAGPAPRGDGPLPVGHPLDGLEVLLIGPDGEPHPTEGEILVRGKHVALGYHGLADDRFGTVRGERTYRTGDLARRLPDGMLTVLGRADRQVKIRGHRVELGDIETRLADLPGVAQAAVTARRAGPNGDLELVGYIVPNGSDAAVDTAALRDVLPDYMIPRAIVRLAELPLTVTGKLDESALPVPDPGTTTAELTAAERAIAEAWSQTLGVPAVGPDVHFFELGGHSLLMGLVQQRLERSLGRKLPMATLFGYPTVRSLAAHLAGSGGHHTAAAAADRAARRQRPRARRVGG